MQNIFDCQVGTCHGMSLQIAIFDVGPRHGVANTKMQKQKKAIFSDSLFIINNLHIIFCIHIQPELPVPLQF